MKKNYTIEDLALIIGYQMPEIQKLSQEFKLGDEETKENILTVLWDGLYELKEKLAKLKYEKLLLEVDEGKRELTSDLYPEAVKQVWQDFDDIVSGKKKEIDQIEEIMVRMQKAIPSKS